MLMPLIAMQTTHSLDNALALARVSQLAYKSVTTAATKAALAKAVGSPLLDIVPLEDPSTFTQGFVAGFDEAIVIAFRGTSSIGDWLQDARIHQVPFRRNGFVHKGFKVSVDGVIDQITETLTAWSGRGRTVWITGHSLGGALAVLCAANLRFPIDAAATIPQPVAGLYTFGQPRVGSDDFRKAVDADIGSVYFRYVNDKDIVTRVPIRPAYQHGGKVRYIDAQGTIQEDPGWWQRFLDLVKGGQQLLDGLRTGQIEFIADHDIAEYIRKISKAKGAA
jgi:triacylglycerol lipase